LVGKRCRALLSEHDRLDAIRDGHAMEGKGAANAYGLSDVLERPARGMSGDWYGRDRHCELRRTCQSQL